MMRPDDASDPPPAFSARPDRPPIDPAEVAAATDRALAALVHELAGLVDGSLRYVRLAERSLTAGESPPGDAPLGEPPPARSYITAAAEALDHAARLIQSAAAPAKLLDPAALAAAGSHKQSLRDVVEHALRVLTPLAEQRGVALDARIDPNLASAQAPPIYPVVANALRNALEASSSGGAVLLDARFAGDDDDSAAPPTSTDDPAPGRTLVLDVTDDGVGLPPDQTDLFNPGVTHKPGNSGLGLAICRDIAAQLHADLSLERRPGCRGSRFRFVLRLQSPPRADP